jgi:hypothetical protein
MLNLDQAAWRLSLSLSQSLSLSLSVIAAILSGRCVGWTRRVSLYVRLASCRLVNCNEHAAPSSRRQGTGLANPRIAVLTPLREAIAGPTMAQSQLYQAGKQSG